MILWSTINQTTRVIPARNQKISKNKIKKNSIWIHDIWGLESSRTDSLVDTHVYKEVAAAKLTTKQNPLYSWWLRGYMRGREDAHDVVRVML
jgi:hypothetical protein